LSGCGGAKLPFRTTSFISPLRMCSLGYSLELAIMFVIRPALALHHLIVTIFLISFRLPAAFRLDEKTAKKGQIVVLHGGGLAVPQKQLFFSGYLFVSLEHLLLPTSLPHRACFLHIVAEKTMLQCRRGVGQRPGWKGKIRLMIAVTLGETWERIFGEKLASVFVDLG